MTDLNHTHEPEERAGQFPPLDGTHPLAETPCPPASIDVQLQKCRAAYFAKWDVFQSRPSLAGSVCVGLRFADNGDGTVSDRLTGLSWERKQDLDTLPNPIDPHDADNRYAWSASGTAADGTVFTAFLPALNTPPCFAGSCDWRVPTIMELQTIEYLGAAGCGIAKPPLGNPCIDPTFGPTWAFGHWSDTSAIGDPTSAWRLRFQDGNVGPLSKTDGFIPVRAVRGCDPSHTCFLASATTTSSTTSTTTAIPSSCEGASYPQCGGTCGPGMICQAFYVDFSGSSGCGCVPATSRCVPGLAPYCGGACPPGTVCVYSLDTCGGCVP